MGRKMKSTKSGKYINPTDQARKEARKRELKKNKKQRLIVRVAVLKGKDPYQIIADLERFDRMEYDFSNPSPLNEKVLRDKRRKLKETWDRICKLYIKDDREKYLELKRLENEYLFKKNLLIKEYEAIKSTQDVNIEDIPLPSSIPEESKDVVINSILKNTKIKKEPPGCPPGLPPNLNIVIDENEDEESEEEEEEEINANKSNRKIKFSDEIEKTNKEGSNLQKFLKEIEQISSEKEKNVDINAHTKTDSEESQVKLPNQTAPVNKQNVFFGATSLQPQQPMLVRPNLPLMPNERSLAPSALMPNPSPLIRLPIVNPGNQMISQVHTTNIYNSYAKKNPEKKQQATIEARPQLRNLSVELTKFTPLALRIRRDEKQVQKKSNIKQSTGYGMINSIGPSTSTVTMNELKNQDKVNTKDDAYEEFMKEMNGLI